MPERSRFRETERVKNCSVATRKAMARRTRRGITATRYQRHTEQQCQCQEDNDLPETGYRRQHGEGDKKPRRRQSDERGERIGRAPLPTDCSASTQTISPMVRASTAQMAAVIRSRSSGNISITIAPMRPRRRTIRPTV
jgi:hypothetical protein